MNRQDVFDKVSKHLLGQMEQARCQVGADKGLCAYKDFDTGNMCAVGCLIPEGHDAQRFMGELPDLLRRFDDMAGVLGIESEGDKTFLYSLQKIHDCNGPDMWNQLLNEFAGRNGLKANF